MLTKPCPRCGKLYPYGKPYCPECMPKYEADKLRHKAENMKRYDAKRRCERVTKFYKSKRWQKLADATLRARGYKCERCGAYAEQVHHRVEIRTEEGWHKRFDPAGLELLCLRCHNAEHGRFGGQAGAPPGVPEKV